MITARNDVARRCFQSLANACLEEDIHNDGDGEGVSEKAKDAMCALAAAQPLAVAVAVGTSLAFDDIGRRDGVGWRGVRRLLEAACCAARSVEAFVKHGSSSAGAGSKVTIMTKEEVDKAVDALTTAAVNEMLQGAIENVTDAVAVIAALAPTFMQPFERAVRGILALIEPGAPPSHHVLVAAGSLASAQPEAFSRFSTEVLSLLLPSLGATKADAARSTTCDTLAAIATSLAVARDEDKRATEALIRSVMELLLGAWLFAGSGFGTEKLIFRIKVIACLGELGACGVINTTTNGKRSGGGGSSAVSCPSNAAILKPSLMRVVALCQSAMQVRPRNSTEIESANELIVDAAKAMHKYLDALSVADALDEGDVGRLMPLLQTLVFASVQASSSQSSSATADATQAAAVTTAWMRCHFELLRCTEVLAASQPDEVCRLLVSKVEGSAVGTSTNAYNSGASSSARSAAYVTIRHLAGRAKWEVHAGLVVGAMVAATTREVLPHMKVEVAKTVTSLAYAGYFKQSGSSELALYLMHNTMPVVTPADARVGTRKGAEAEAAAVAEVELREVCSKSLQLIVSTEVENTRQAVWPSLLHFMLAMQPGNDDVEGVDDALRCISACSAAAMSRSGRAATTGSDTNPSIGISPGTETNNGNATILVRLLSLLHQVGARRAMLAGLVSAHSGTTATKEKTGHARLRALRKRKLVAVQSSCENLLSCAELLVESGVIMCVGTGGRQIEDTIALLRGSAHNDDACWASGCDELLASIIEVNVMANPAYACNDSYIRWVGSSTLSLYSSPDDAGGSSSLRDTALHRMLGVLISISTSRDDATKYITCLMTRLTGYINAITSPPSAASLSTLGEDHAVFGAHVAGIRAIAEAVGRASTEYVDIVLNALRNVQVTSKDTEDANGSSTQSSGRGNGRAVGFGLFGGGRRTSTSATRDSGTTKHKSSCGKTQILSAALQLCYAEVCRRCPCDVLLSRVQTHVFPLLLGFASSGDTNRVVMTRESIFTESVEAVAESILNGQDAGSSGTEDKCAQVHTCVSESVEKLVATVDDIVRKHASLPSNALPPIRMRTGDASRSAKKKRASPASVLNGLDDEDDNGIDPGIMTADGNGHDDEVNVVGSINADAMETVACCLSCLGKLCRLGLGLGSIQRATAVRTCVALLESDGGSDDARIVTAIVDFVGGIYTKSLECVRDADDADILTSLVGAIKPLLSASKNTTRANAWKLLFLLLKASKSYLCGDTKGARACVATTSSSDVANIFGALAAQSLARGCDDRSAPVRKFALKSLNALVEMEGTATARKHSEPLKAAITSLSVLDFRAFNDDSKDVGGADFFDALQAPLEACMRSLSAIVLAEDGDTSNSSTSRFDSVVDFCSSAALGIGDTSFCTSCCFVMMLTILVEQHGSVLIKTGTERIVRDCISGSSSAQFERARVGGINALRFLCQVYQKNQVSIAGIISQLLTIEDESEIDDSTSSLISSPSTPRFHRSTVHQAFQNLASSKSIGAEASLCVLNVLMKSRLLDGVGGDADSSSTDDESRKQNAAARVLRALLETPKGASELLLSRRGELMMAVMMRYWMAQDDSGVESCPSVLDTDGDVGSDSNSNAAGFSCSSGGASSEMIEAAMLLRAYVGATMTQLARTDSDRDIFSSKREDIVNIIVCSHISFCPTEAFDADALNAADIAKALATIQEIFMASKELQRRPLAACRELAACVIGCIGRNLSIRNDGDLPAGVDGLLQHVIESLSMAAGDSSVSVRCHALTGLSSIVRPSISGSNISAGTLSQIALVNSQVVGLLHRCCDDESYDAVIAGLGGITHIFKQLSDASAAHDTSLSSNMASNGCMGASLSPLPTAMRVRRCFVSGGARVRAAALTTFTAILGTVTDDTSSGCIESWRELVHDSMSVIILLVNDMTNAGVRKAAKTALRASVKVLSLRSSHADGSHKTSSSSLSELISGPGLDPDKRLQYAGFLKSVSAIVCRDYALEVDAYLKNVLNECRRGSPLETNALLFGAHLLSARGQASSGGGAVDSRTKGQDTASKSASTSFSQLLLERLGSDAASASGYVSGTRKSGTSLIGGGTSGGSSSTRQAAVAALSVLLMDDM